MSLRKRGGIWWVDVRARDGERIRRTTGTANKALAQEAHDRFKSELWRIGHLGDKPRHTWNDAVVRWLKEQSHKATAKEDVSKLRWLHRSGGSSLTDWRLYKLLEAFDIKSTPIRIGSESRKGFKVEQFSEAFARYLGSAETGETTKQQRPDSVLSDSDSDPRFETAPLAETDNSASDKDCFGVSRCAPDQPDRSVRSSRVVGQPKDNSRLCRAA